MSIVATLMALLALSSAAAGQDAVSTYLPGGVPLDIATDASGWAYALVHDADREIVTSAGAYVGVGDVYVVALEPDLGAPAFVARLDLIGGTASIDVAADAIVVAGNAPGNYDPDNSYEQDGGSTPLTMALSLAGSSVLWSSTTGSSGDDSVVDVAAGTDGRLVVVGEAGEPDFGSTTLWPTPDKGMSVAFTLQQVDGRLVARDYLYRQVANPGRTDTPEFVTAKSRVQSVTAGPNGLYAITGMAKGSEMVAASAVDEAEYHERSVNAYLWVTDASLIPEGIALLNTDSYEALESCAEDYDSRIDGVTLNAFGGESSASFTATGAIVWVNGDYVHVLSGDLNQECDGVWERYGRHIVTLDSDLNLAGQQGLDFDLGAPEDDAKAAPMATVRGKVVLFGLQEDGDTQTQDVNTLTLSDDLSSVETSTFYGGSGQETVVAAVGDDVDIVVLGTTSSPDLPGVTNTGPVSGFVARIPQVAPGECPSVDGSDIRFRITGDLAQTDLSVVLTTARSDESPLQVSRARPAGCDIGFTGIADLLQSERKLERVDVFEDGQLVGHLPLNVDTEAWAAHGPLDAYLTVHTEPDLRPDPEVWERPNLELGVWEYYADGEMPMTMLVPPGLRFDSVDTSQRPAVLVHGINGRYPYWGGAVIDSAQVVRDTWQFYYPNDQPIDYSGPLLSEALGQVIEALPRESTGYCGNEPAGCVDLVAHSMGGLVSRHYIQSEAIEPYPGGYRYTDGRRYRGDVRSLLMLGTPNHGSYSGWRGRTEAIGWLGAEISGDGESPALWQMAPGSNFLNELNGSSARSLESLDVLVVAGYQNLLFVPYLPFSVRANVEVDDQDDGVVSVSSASLLYRGVPLVTTYAVHSPATDKDDDVDSYALNTDTGPFVKRFLNGIEPPSEGATYCEGTGCDVAPQSQYWTSSSSFGAGSVADSRLNSASGVTMVTIENLSEFAERELPWEENSVWSVRREGQFIHLCRGGAARTRMVRSLANGPERNETLFSVDAFGLNSIGWSFPRGTYQLVLERAFGRTCEYVRRKGELSFEPLTTTRTVFDLTSLEGTIISAPSALSPLAGSTRTASGRAVAQYEVDASVDSLVFWMAGLDGRDASLSLVTPGGQTITPSTLPVGAEYDANVEEGFARYYVRSPEHGTWTVQHADGLDGTRLFAPVNGAVEVAVTVPDSAFVAGETARIAVVVPEAAVCSSPTATASVAYVADEDGDGTPLGAITLSQVAETRFEGEVLLGDPGAYYVQADVSCSYEGQTVERSASGALTAIDPLGTSIPDGPGEGAEDLGAPYPNPVRNTLTVPVSLSEPSSVRVVVYDLLGRQVASVTEADRPTGPHSVVVDVGSLAESVYVVRTSVHARTGATTDRADKIIVVR